MPVKGKVKKIMGIVSLKERGMRGGWGGGGGGGVESKHVVDIFTASDTFHCPRSEKFLGGNEAERSGKAETRQVGVLPAGNSFLTPSQPFRLYQGETELI